MGYPDYKRDLLDESVSIAHLLEKYFHYGLPAVFNGASADEAPTLIRSVASGMLRSFQLHLHSHELVICGSAHLGFTPVPGPNLGRSFDPKRSDIDIAVISSEFFNRWWRELQEEEYDMDDRTANRVADNIFLGLIDPSVVRDVGTIGPAWWSTFGELRTDRAKGIRGRLYKDFWCMTNYHRIAVAGGRRQLLRARGAR